MPGLSDPLVLNRTTCTETGKSRDGRAGQVPGQASVLSGRGRTLKPAAMRRLAQLLAFANLLSFAVAPASAKSIAAPRVDIIDRHHGVAVPDPYRWLENADNADAQRWTRAQNKLTQAYFDGLAARKAIRAKREELTIKLPLEQTGRAR